MRKFLSSLLISAILLDPAWASLAQRGPAPLPPIQPAYLGEAFTPRALHILSFQWAPEPRRQEVLAWRASMDSLIQRERARWQGPRFLILMQLLGTGINFFVSAQMKAHDAALIMASLWVPGAAAYAWRHRAAWTPPQTVLGTSS